MATIVISEQARVQIADALEFSERQYGPAKRAEYEALFRETLEERTLYPLLGKARPEIHPEARILGVSRGGKRARHVLLYRVVGHPAGNDNNPSEVQIARCLHDAMQLETEQVEDW